MKKLMLACTAALFSLASFAQENQQDSTRTETDQYRQNQTDQNMDTTSIDSTSNQYRQDAEELKNEGEKEIDTLQQDATQMRDTLVEQGNDAATEIKNDAREMRDSVRQETEQVGNEVQKDAQRTSDQNTTDGASTMSSENSGENAVASEVEIVEGKEGPNNEVVYKFNGAMWYVDRESKEMVKAEESKLKDSRHEVTVHEGTTTVKGKNNKKGKD